MRLRRFSVCLSVGLLGLACNQGIQARDQSGPPPVLVNVLDVQLRTLPLALDAVGTLMAPERTTIAAEMDEQIVGLEIPEGAFVEAGHVLVTLDGAEARAQLEAARASLANARARQKRLESLRASSVSSQQAYDDAVETLRRAEAALAEAQTRLAKTEIRTPFSGVLGLAQVTPGQYLKSGDSIVELTRVNPLDLVFRIPQEDAGRLAVGQPVFGNAGTCGDRFEGRILAVEPRVDPDTRTVGVKARVPNESGGLLTGMAVRVRVLVSEIPGAVQIPQEAVIRQGGRYVVYVLDEQGVAHQQAIELGQYFVDGVHVTKGLAEGDTVVIAGHQKLRPGAATQSEPYEPVENPTLQLGWIGPAGGCGE